MVGVRGPAGLVGVVALLRPFLVTIQRFDRDIAVENPGDAEERCNGLIQVILEPFDPRRFVHPPQIAAYRILTHHLGHPQQRGIEGVTAQGADVRITLMAGEKGQHGGAQDVAVARGIGAGQREGATGHPGLKAAAHLQEVDKEGQLAQGRHRRLGIPLHMDAAAKGVDGNRAGNGRQRCGAGFTRRVKGQLVHRHLLLPLFHYLASSKARGDCPF